MLRKGFIAAALLLTTAIPALAQDWHSDQRQYRQERRIQEGLARGEITPREAARLRQENWHIEQMQRRAIADGYVSPRERRRIEAAQDHLGRAIRRESRDDQRRYGGLAHGGYGGWAYR